MAFFIDQSDSYDCPVVVKEIDENGRERKYPFTVRFRRVTQSRHDELVIEVARQQNRIKAGNLDGDILTSMQIADEIMVGWSDVKTKPGPDGVDVPFTEELKASVLNRRGVADAIVEAWIGSEEKAKAKN